MQEMAASYLPVVFLCVLALGLAGLFSGLGLLLGPRHTDAVKRMPFESGMPSTGTGFRRYSVRFYMIALTFLIFDVEIVFFFPWAVRFREWGMHAFWVMVPFFALLLLGLVYDWKKGALEWE